MITPFFGLSLITHLIICFVYEAAVFINRIVLGPHKKKKSDELNVLFREKDEQVIPGLVIGMVFGSLFLIAGLSIQTSIESRPNNIDGILNTVSVVQAATKNQHQKSDIPSPYPLSEGNYQFYSFNN